MDLLDLMDLPEDLPVHYKEFSVWDNSEDFLEVNVKSLRLNAHKEHEELEMVASPWPMSNIKYLGVLIKIVQSFCNVNSVMRKLLFKFQFDIKLW